METKINYITRVTLPLNGSPLVARECNTMMVIHQKKTGYTPVNVYLKGKCVHKVYATSTRGNVKIRGIIWVRGKRERVNLAVHLICSNRPTFSCKLLHIWNKKWGNSVVQIKYRVFHLGTACDPSLKVTF